METIKHEKTTIPLISDLLIGTRLYTPKILDGTGIVLSNKSDIKAIVINGGLIARVPKYFGKRNAQFFELLDFDLEKKYGKRVADKTKEIHDLKKLDFDELEGEIKEKPKKSGEETSVGVDTLEDLIEIAQPEIAKIKADSKVKFYYVWGEEDYGNVADLIETRIQELIQIKDVKRKGLEDRLKSAQITLKEKAAELERKQINIEGLKTSLQELKGNNKNKAEKKIGKLEKDLKKEVGAYEHANVAYRSFEKHVAQQKEESDILLKRIRSFTKTWAITREEYSNPEKEGVRNRAVREYKELIFPMFKGKDLKIISHLEEVIEANGTTLNLSHNRNALISDAPNKSGISRRIDEAKIKNKRGELLPDFDVESHHLDGFKFCVQMKTWDKGDPIYFIQLPTMQDTEELRTARKEWVKTWDTKRFDSSYASGLTLLNVRKDGVTEVEFYSSDLLKKIGEEGKLKKMDLLKIEIFSDAHIGAPNEPGRITNYEMMEAIKKYQANEKPDIIVVAGDIINGQHLDQIVHEYPNKVPSQYEIDRQELKSKKISEEQRKLALEELTKQERYGGPITDVTKQKEEVKLRLYEPYWKEVLKKGGEIIFVSGQHYNKSSRFREDEAHELANMVDSEYKKQVHVFGGKTFGSGQENVKGINIFAIHAPRRAQDEVTGLMRHTVKTNRKPQLAVGGDYHHPGIGWADGTAYVAAAGLQTWNQFVDEIGKQGGMRGIINVYMDPQIEGYVKYELVLDPALKKVLKDMK